MAFFVFLAALAMTPLGRHYDHLVGVWAAHAAGMARPDLMVIWLLGSPVVSTLLLLLFTADAAYSWQVRLTAWVLAAVGGVVEVTCKHYGIGGSVNAVGVAAMPHVGAWLDAIQRHLSIPIPGDLASRATHFILRGSFPSGHVLRLTLAAAYALPRPGWTVPTIVAATCGFMVVATGGHTLTDALGGACLAFALLAGAGRLRASAGGTVGSSDRGAMQ